MVVIIGGELVADDDPRAVKMRQTKQQKPSIQTPIRGPDKTTSSATNANFGSILNFNSTGRGGAPATPGRGGTMPQGYRDNPNGSASSAQGEAQAGSRDTTRGSAISGLLRSLGLSSLETTTVRIPRISLLMVNRPSTEVPILYIVAAALLTYFMGPIALVVIVAIYLFSAPPSSGEDVRGGGVAPMGRYGSGSGATGPGSGIGQNIHSLH